MAVSVDRVRLDEKAEVALPAEVRQALGSKFGDDDLAIVIEGTEVRVVRPPAGGDDALLCFSEWATEVDSEGYADL